jgi:ectoine hydroxylase
MSNQTLGPSVRPTGAGCEWSPTLLEQYHSQGYVLCRGLFSEKELQGVQDELPSILAGEDAEDDLHRERERSGAVRQVYLAHRHNALFRDLTQNAKITAPVRQILKSDCYVWHSKINVKDAFEGTVWLWHQDYGYWQFDGVDPRFVTAMVLLDRATVNNGSLMVVPGSHRWGTLAHYSDAVTTSYKQWCIEKQELVSRVKEEMIVHVTGEPGDVLFFDSNLVHGSGHNMSPLSRNTYLAVYNSIHNKPRPVENPRPDWVVARDFEVVPLT